MSGPPRILFASHYSGLGGGETSLLGLMGELHRWRFACALVCPREGQLTEAARALGVQVHVVPYRGASIWFVPALWAAHPATRRLAACVTRARPDVVHGDFHTLPYLVPACRALGVPVIFTCYGWWFRPRWWQRAFYRGGPAAILAISEAVKQGFLGSPPFMPPDRVRVEHLGIDTRAFRPRAHESAVTRRQLGLPASAPLVTLVARFQDVKGHDVFLDAAKRVAANRPDAHFAVAGETVFGSGAETALKARVRAEVERDAAMRPRVSLLGWISQPERLLAASDVVVCSSRFESFGMVNVEAMACEVPVVSTNVGGPAETVLDGVTGCLVPPARPDLIADRVLALLSDERRRREMGRAGRARVQSLFSLERYARSFAGIASSLAGPSQAAVS
jgi:glycosyltransferase involved in cell wall biosynthesis